MTAVTDNRRKSARQKVFLDGRIYFNNRQSTVDCLVRDFSPDGAKLKVSEAVAIPETIDLYILARDETYHAKVRWRRGVDVGVSFIPEEKAVLAVPVLAPGDPATDLAARVQ